MRSEHWCICLVAIAFALWLIFGPVKQEPYKMSMPKCPSTKQLDKYHKVYSIKLDGKLPLVAALLDRYVFVWDRTKLSNNKVSQHFPHPMHGPRSAAHWLRLRNGCQEPLRDPDRYMEIEDYLDVQNKRPSEQGEGLQGNEVWDHRFAKYSANSSKPAFTGSSEFAKMMKSFQDQLGHPPLARSGIRGLFWYPPGAFREWHTNKKHPPGWRAYIVAVKPGEPSLYVKAKKDLPSSYLGIMRGSNFVVSPDRNYELKLFHIRPELSDLNWHTVMSLRNDRLSLGINPSEALADHLISLADRVY